ncbi:hypothetical protein Taro_029322 [Colocasia esculenta]|uniref:Uncharacterized protein n=1 Tax=Colocasia esculenta TaxID=4460 RepID=A0A843VSY3_COLES|nr:hypothetical protein [Colocasia esculenta]
MASSSPHLKARSQGPKQGEEKKGELQGDVSRLKTSPNPKVKLMMDYAGLQDWSNKSIRNDFN